MHIHTTITHTQALVIQTAMATTIVITILRMITHLIGIHQVIMITIMIMVIITMTTAMITKSKL